MHSSLVELWNNFNFLTAIIVLIGYAIVDAMYAYYTLSIQQLRPTRAATVGSLMHIILAFGVLSYVGNFLYVIPIVIGSWIGTYFVVKREGRSNLKK